MKFITRISLFLASLIGCAGASPTFASQSTSYEYNEAGQVVTEDGPRTDISDITSYTYDARGNVATHTNALNHVTKYTSYDGNGKLLSVTDPNGITTEFTYHEQGWILSSRLKHPTDITLDALTTYKYDAVGQLIGTSLPNGATLAYKYDGARRLVAVTNGLNERIEYTLDAAGNRTKQVTKSATGVITYSVNTTFDELSRVTKVAGNNSQQDRHQYDANDNRTATTDGRNNQTQRRYDALNRVTKIIDPSLGEAQFTYNNQNRISTVTDARGNVTTYSYDGLGNLLSQTSPDTGTTTFTYDAAGNRLTSTDARNLVTSYTYDALNRIKRIQYPSATESVDLTYDNLSSKSIGRISKITKTGFGLTYGYNHQGLVIRQTNNVNGLSKAINYTYDKAGQLTRIAYPGGRWVDYAYDLHGRVKTISTKLGTAAAQTLVNNISYLPFGPAKSYSYGNGLTHTQNFDQDYRLTAIQVGAATNLMNRSYGYDPVNNITSITNGLHSAHSQALSYDTLNRLITAAGGYGNLAYSYDAVGNRLSETRNGTSDTYSYAYDSNRLASISGANGNTGFSYDKAGNRIQKSTSGPGSTTPFSLTVQAESYTAMVGVGTETTADVGGGLDVGWINNNDSMTYSSINIPSTGTYTITYRIASPSSTGSLAFEAITGTAYNTIAIPFTGGWQKWQSVQSNITLPAGTHNFKIKALIGGFNINWFKIESAGSSTNNNSTQTYSYNNANRLAAASIDSAQAASYDYNPLGQRILKALPDGTKEIYHYDEAGRLIAVTDAPGATVREYIYWGNQQIALVTNGQIYYIHNDHLNTPQVMTNASQQVVWMGHYEPFGKLAANQTNSIEIFSRFPGQYLDKETGLYYNYFRDYDPSIGRYVQSDPIGLKGGINTYAYVGGNPLRYVDPLGLYWGESYVDYAGDVLGATGDFAEAYADQVDATHGVGGEHNGWANQDKYFHCRANCEAAQRGEGGEAAAECLSDAREEADQLMGDPASASGADQVANQFGRSQGAANPNGNCSDLCDQYRPGGSFPF